MKLVSSSVRPLTKRERLMVEFDAWEDSGRVSAPTARILAGQYATRYRQRYHMTPMSPVQEDLEHFDSMLSLLDEDKHLAPYCIDVLFALKEFNVNAKSFSNPNVLDKWNVVERAHKLRKRDGVTGEQAEFRSSESKKYGITRV